MLRFRAKPAVIQAYQYFPPDRWPRDWNVPPGICTGQCGEKSCHPDRPGIHTLEGTMRVSPGDWIIKGVKNEFYACKPDVFAIKYELVDPVIDSENATGSTQDPKTRQK